MDGEVPAPRHGTAVFVADPEPRRGDEEDSLPSEPPALDGRYILGPEVGRGGMATVYRARDTVLDRTVAVKVFAPYAALPDDDVRRAAEVRLLAGLNHPGLVMVYDAGSGGSDADGPFDYVVMEFVAGTTLARAIASGPLPPTEVAKIGAQLVAGLGYVHASGIVHRDIKPPNVLLSEGSAGTIAKLADFGVARLVDSTRLTVQGTTLGTPNYLSPEQATGEPVTAASDIYSLGLVLLEALTGQRAFPGFGVEAVVQRLHRQPDIPSHLGAGWKALLTAMTAPAPGKRPDAHTVQLYLQHLADPTRPTVPGARLSRPAAATRIGRVARHWGWVWPAGGAAATAALAAVLWAALLSGSNAPAAAFEPVPGPLGADLHLLETAAPPQLHDDLVSLTQAAASGQRSAARHDLDAVASDLRTMRRSGTIDTQRYWETHTAIAAVLADLQPPAPAARPAQRSGTKPASHAPYAPSARLAPQPPGHGHHGQPAGPGNGSAGRGQGPARPEHGSAGRGHSWGGYGHGDQGDEG